MSTLHTHESNDWCHICGVRQDHLADIWFPENAEHDKTLTRHIRICSICAQGIGLVARGETPSVVETNHPKGTKHESKYKKAGIPLAQLLNPGIVTPQVHIQAALKKVPTLTNYGVGLSNIGKRLSPEERRHEIETGKKKLFENVKEFQKACDWFSQKDKRKTINPNHSSYDLKHIAEKEIGYTTNGTFIAAALHCGFDFKIISGSPNVMFNISENSLKNKGLSIN